MNANRRLQERKLPERIVLCKLGGEESSFVLNLSEDGLGFESHKPIEKSGVLQLRLSAEMDGTIETTGRLAWLDSAKRTGGLRFLELSAPAREQIRAWLSDTATPSSETDLGVSLQKYDKQAVERALPDKPAPHKPVTDMLAIWRDVSLPSMQLVPIERHRAQNRRHFLGGLFVGFAICALLMIAFSWYVSGIKPGSLAWTTASANSSAPPRAQQTQQTPQTQPSPSAPRTQAAPSGQRTQALLVQPFSPFSANPPIPKPAPTKPLAKDSATMQTATATAPIRPLRTAGVPPAGSPQNQTQTRNQKQSPPSAGASPTNLLTGTQPSLAVPAPAASNAHSSSGQVQGPIESKVERTAEGPVKGQVQPLKKVPPTPEQLWAALQKGNVKAAVALADLYARGDGVPQNCQQARVLLQVASEKHNAEASRKLEELDKTGCPANTASE